MRGKGERETCERRRERRDETVVECDTRSKAKRGVEAKERTEKSKIKRDRLPPHETSTDADDRFLVPPPLLPGVARSEPWSDSFSSLDEISPEDDVTSLGKIEKRISESKDREPKLAEEKRRGREGSPAKLFLERQCSRYSKDESQSGKVPIPKKLKLIACGLPCLR